MSSKQERRAEHVPAPKTQQQLADVAIKSASSLMGLQVLSRLVTFSLNQALVRLATPAVYGTVSIQLELLLNTILFLSREGFRNALLRANVDGEDSNKGKRNPALVSNIALLPLYFGVLVSSLTSATYMYYASEDTREQPYFWLTVVLYTSAAVLELFSEPLHIRSAQTLNSAVRVRAEGSAVIVKSVTTVAVLLYDSYSSSASGHLGLLAFALGQMSYSIMLLIVYLREYGVLISYVLRRTDDQQSAAHGKTSKQPLPSSAALGSGKYFDKGLLEVSLAMTVQGFMKHVLTEGDKLIISRISPLKDQGGYAVANNYGSLIARIFFQPIEETSRLFFSKTLTSSDSKGLGAGALQTALSRLGSLVLVYSHFSLFLISLVPPYLDLVLTMVLPPRYLNTSAPAVLSAWIWYIPVLSVNGVLEAFVSSVASPKDLAKQSQWMAGASVAYITLTIVLYQMAGLGDSAVIYANIANLVARIFYCLHFLSSLVSRQNKDKGGKVRFLAWEEVLPPSSALFGFAIAGVVTRISARVLGIEEPAQNVGRGILKSKACLLHIGVGGACGLALLAICFLTERENVRQFLSLLFSRTRKKAE